MSHPYFPSPPRLTARSRFVLALDAAALLPALSFGQVGTGGALRTWIGANTNFQNVNNWLTVPDFSDGEATTTGVNKPAGTDSLFFDNGANLAVNFNAPSGANNGTVFYTLRSFEFGANAGAFTFQTTNTRTLVLGDSTSQIANPSNTGNILNGSVSTQTFNVPVKFRFGTVDAAEGQIVFSQSVNVGSDLTGSANNLTIAGSSGVPGQSVVTINGALLGNGTDTSDGGALIKTGTGTLILNGNNSAWNGRIAINDGVVQVGTATALGSTAGRTTLAGGFSAGQVKFTTLATTTTTIAENFHIGGRVATNAPHFVNAAGRFEIASTINLDDGGQEYGFRSDAELLSLSGNVGYGTAAGSANLRLSGAGDGVISGAIGTGGAEISVIKEGSGTWTLTGINAYTGETRVSGGRLNIGTNLTGAGDLSVGDIATLGLTRNLAGQTLIANTLTLGTATGGALAIDLGAFGSSANPVISTGDFTTNGISSIVVAGGGLSLGTIPLIDYAGSILGNGFAGLSLSGLPPRVTAALVNDTVGTKISLNVTAFDFPKWTGSVSGVWDVNNGPNPATGSGTQNWKEANSGTATRYLQTGNTVDSVLFDDSATGTTDVVLGAIVSPLALTVNNTSKTYTFTGAGKISGVTNVVKQGPGTLILANAGGNDYTGTTTISGGVVQLGDGVTPGAGQFGTGQVINNGSIVLNRAYEENYAVGANISGAGGITKIDDNVTTLNGSSSFDGTVTVDVGTLKLGSNTALGSAAGGVSVNPGATFDVGDFQAPLGEVITIRGTGAGLTPVGALTSSGPAGGTTAGLHNLALAANASIGGTKRFDVRDGTLTGGGFKLTKIGANSIYLANLGETGLGDIAVDSGRLAFEGTTTFGAGPGTVQIGATGELGLESSTALQTKAVQLNGGKIVFNMGIANQLGGALTLAAGANTVQGPTTGAATLTVSGNIGGTGNLTKTQLGTLVLTGTNSYTGGTVVSGGAVHFPVQSAVPASGQVTLAANGTVGFGFDFDQTFLTTYVAPTGNPSTLALGVDSAHNYHFANYPGLSLGAYSNVTYSGTLTPAGTATSGAYNLGGGGGTLTYTGPLTGNNTLNIGAGGSGGTVILSGASNHTGRTTITAGSTLILARPSALGAATNPLTHAGILDLNGNNLTVGGLTAAQNVATVVITDNSPFAGTTVLTDNIASGSSTYGSAIKDGANGRKLALVKAGAGTLIINGANLNTYTGGTTISGGRLEIRSNQANALPVGGDITLAGNGTLSATNNGTANTAVSLLLGNLTFAAGEGIIEQNNLGAKAAISTTTFTALPTRAAGATGNFTLLGPSAASSYKVVLTAAPASGLSLNGGLFFGGDSFAAYDNSVAGGYVRALNYTTDANAADLLLTEDQPGFGVVAGKDVQLRGGAFSLTNQTTQSVRSLKIAEANNITFNPGATLTISGGGLIKTGGSAATISGGDGLTTGGAGDLVVRTAGATDTLTINTNILASTTGGLTKSGAGTLILGGTTNSFTGGIWVNSGTLRFTAAEAIPATGDIRLGVGAAVAFGQAFDQALLAARVPATVNAATVALAVDNANSFDFSATGLNYSAISLGAIGIVNYTGTLTPNGTAYRLGGGGGTITFSSPLTGANSLIVGGSGSGGTVILTAANSYSGGTVLSLGTLRLANAAALGATTGPVTITGGTLDLRGFNQTLTDLSGGGGTITDNTPSSTELTTLTVNVASASKTYSGSINDGTGGRILKLIKDGIGTLILSKANGNNYSGGTFIKKGRLEVRTQNAQVLPLGSPLTFNGSGIFAAANNGDATVTTASLTLGALTLNAGDATIESGQLGASATNVLTFAATPVRAAGATANFTLTVASDPSLYKVVFTDAPATGRSVNGGLFYNFADFLAYDTAGYARALRYTGTPDANATDVTLAADQATLGTGLTERDVQLGGSGRSITAQTSETLRSLKIASGTNLTLDVGQTLTLSGGGLLKTGGGSSVIGGGDGLTTGGAGDLVARVDTFDTLTIATPILASTSGGLTKAGLGKLVLSAANTYGGNTVVNGGSLIVSGSISGTTAVTVNPGATLGGAGNITTTGGNVTVASGGNLAPGDSAGTLTLALGLGQLDLSPAAGGSGWLKFELGVTSDQVVLASGSLNIGSGLFDLADFNFTDSGGFFNGTYTLFDSNAGIIGTLGTNLNGTILGREVTLTFAHGINGRDDLILVVVPEPGTASALLGGLGLLVGWRRLGRRGAARTG